MLALACFCRSSRVTALETVAEYAASRRKWPGAVTAVEVSIAATIRLLRRIVIIEDSNREQFKDQKDDKAR
jgi:hypothetical protein